MRHGARYSFCLNWPGNDNILECRYGAGGVAMMTVKGFVGTLNKRLSTVLPGWTAEFQPDPEAMEHLGIPPDDPAPEEDFGTIAIAVRLPDGRAIRMSWHFGEDLRYLHDREEYFERVGRQMMFEMGRSLWEYASKSEAAVEQEPPE